MIFPPSESIFVAPDGIPDSIRPVILANYTKYDEFRMIAKDYEAQIIEKVKSMDWETGNGVLSGDEMLSILTSTPQIGIITACLWLLLSSRSPS